MGCSDPSKVEQTKKARVKPIPLNSVQESADVVVLAGLAEAIAIRKNTVALMEAAAAAKIITIKCLPLILARL